MFKGIKFKKAEKDFAQHSKSFDQFCSENNIEIKSEKKNIKRNIWISVFATAATAAIVVCSCIPLMRQAPIGEYYYSEIDVSTNQVTIEDIVGDSRNLKLFNIDYIEDYTLAQSIYPNNNQTTMLGYHIKDVLWYREIESVEYVFEFDYIARTDWHYRFKNLALYSDCTDTINNNDVSYKYRIVDSEFGNDVYITYAVSGVDYYIHMYESEYTIEYNKENIETFITLAY